MLHKMHRRQMGIPEPCQMRGHYQQWREKLPLKLQTQSRDNKHEPGTCSWKNLFKFLLGAKIVSWA